MASFRKNQSGRNDLPIVQQGGGAVVVVGGNAKDVHGRQSRTTSAQTIVGGYPGRTRRLRASAPRRSFFQIVTRFRPADGDLRAAWCEPGVGDAALEYDGLAGKIDSKHSAIVCTVRTRNHRGAYQRQDGCGAAKGQMDGRRPGVGIRGGWANIINRFPPVKSNNSRDIRLLASGLFIWGKPVKTFSCQTIKDKNVKK